MLVISHEILNRNSGTVIAMAITSQQPRAGFPLHQAIQSLKMPKPSWVKISQIRTLSIERLRKRIGSLQADEVNHIVDGLVELVG